MGIHTIDGIHVFFLGGGGGGGVFCPENEHNGIPFILY